MKGSGEQCGNKKCIEFDEEEGSRCLKRDWPEECKLYDPLIAQTEPVSEVPCSAGLCANSELIRDLKAHLGVDGERKGVEYCTIYDEEWADIIRMIQDAQY